MRNALASSQLSQIEQMWPFNQIPHPLTKSELRSCINSHLPSWERASALIEAHFEIFAWYFSVVDRAQVVEELLPRIYKRQSSAEKGVSAEVDMHELALLLMVFACGAAGDLTLTACNEEGELYQQLARAALGLQPVLEEASLATVQAIGLLAVYSMLTGHGNTLETMWRTMGLGMVIANCVSSSIYSIFPSLPGLKNATQDWSAYADLCHMSRFKGPDNLIKDRDPARWNLSSQEIQRRRRVFWEMYNFDKLQASHPAFYKHEYG